MELNSAFWSDRYLSGQTGWDLGEVSTPLKIYFDQLSDKSIKVLIPGGGNGYEVEYLFKKGFENVYLLDWSLEPLKYIKSKLPDFPNYNLINEDFFDHHERYDMIVEQTFFCAIDKHLRPLYAKQASDLLKGNGNLMGLLFDELPETGNPPFGGTKEEYQQYFEPHFDIEKMERCYNSIEPRAGRELFIKLNKRTKMAG